MVPTAAMGSATIRPQARNEPGQRDGPASAAQDHAFAGALRKALPGGGDEATDSGPGRGRTWAPGAAVPVQAEALVSGDQVPQPATAELSPERALAMLKQLLAEHGITELPALTEVPVPHAQVPDETVPAGVQALVAAMAQALLQAIPPGQSPVQAETAAAGADAVATPPAESGARLERFIRDVAATLMSEPAAAAKGQAAVAEGQAAVAEGQAAAAQPTFQDLVRLIAGATPEQAPTEAVAAIPEQSQPEAPAATPIAPTAPAPSQLQAPAESQAQAGNQPQFQNRPQPQQQPQMQTQAQVQAPQPPQPAITKAKPTEPTTPATGPIAQLQAPSALTGTQPADPAPTQARPPIDPEQVVRQAARFVRVALEGQRSEVRFQMHPDHLGAIAVKLVLTEGVVKASMTAADPAVKAVLEANLEQLRSRLADQGLRVEQIQVTLGGGSATGQSHQSPNERQQQPGQPGRYPSPERDGSPDTANEQAQTGPRRPAPTWLPGRKGARIDSLA